MPIDFGKLQVSTDDSVLIGRIVQRMADAVKAHGLPHGKTERDLIGDLTMHAMDITAVHALSCPLHLLRWLMSDGADFVHDYIGIVQHIDRDTGRLCGDWRPMFAKAKH